MQKRKRHRNPKDVCSRIPKTHTPTHKHNNLGTNARSNDNAASPTGRTVLDQTPGQASSKSRHDPMCRYWNHLYSGSRSASQGIQMLARRCVCVVGMKRNLVVLLPLPHPSQHTHTHVPTPIHSFTNTCTLVPFHSWYQQVVPVWRRLPTRRSRSHRPLRRQ